MSETTNATEPALLHTYTHWAAEYRGLHEGTSDEIVDGAWVRLILYQAHEKPARYYVETTKARLFSREIRDYADGSRWLGPWQEFAR